MRHVTDRIAQWPCGRYFFTWCGDELLMQATDDASAIAEGVVLLLELEQE